MIINLSGVVVLNRFLKITKLGPSLKQTFSHPKINGWKMILSFWGAKGLFSGEPPKKNLLLPLYWFVNRDPYNGLL